MGEPAPDVDFVEFIRRIRQGDQAAAEALIRRYEPEIRLEIRTWLRVRDPRLRRVFDSMDICQSVLAIFFVRAAIGEFELDEPTQLIRLLVGMARNRLAEQVRFHQRQRRDVRRTGANAARGRAGRLVRRVPQRVALPSRAAPEVPRAALRRRASAGGPAVAGPRLGRRGGRDGRHVGRSSQAARPRRGPHRGASWGSTTRANREIGGRSCPSSTRSALVRVGPHLRATLGNPGDWSRHGHPYRRLPFVRAGVHRRDVDDRATARPPIAGGSICANSSCSAPISRPPRSPNSRATTRSPDGTRANASRPKPTSRAALDRSPTTPTHSSRSSTTNMPSATPWAKPPGPRNLPGGSPASPTAFALRWHSTTPWKCRRRRWPTPTNRLTNSRNSAAVGPERSVIRDPRRAGARRHGRGVQGPPPGPESARGAEGHQRRRRGDRPRPREVPRRGRGRRAVPAREHHPAPRGGRPRRPGLPLARIRRRRQPPHGVRRHAAAPARLRRSGRDARRRDPPRPRMRHHPPRPEAGQHRADRRRDAQGHRFRPGQAHGAG